MVYLKYFIAWFGIVILGLINATIHQVVYAKYVSELAGDQIVTLTFAILVGLYAWVFNRLGYEYAPDTARKSVAYYEPRTTHGSTLSYVVHAAILANLDPERSWEMFMTALESDASDIQGGTTQEGIHMGVMAGTLDLIQRGYVGAEIRDTALCFKPKPSDRLNGLSFHIRFRETPIEITLNGTRLAVSAHTDGSNRSIKIGVGEHIRELKNGERHTFSI